MKVSRPLTLPTRHLNRVATITSRQFATRGTNLGSQNHASCV